MYIENKGSTFVEHSLGGVAWRDSFGVNLTGPARIGRVTYSKTGATIYYQGHSLQSLKGRGFKSHYLDIESGEHFWVSGPKKNGEDALYPTNIPAEIDEDVREEYRTKIRKQPEKKHQKHT